MLRVLTKTKLPTAYAFYFLGFETLFFFLTLCLFLILYFQPDNGPFQAETCRGNITFNTCECCVAHRGNTRSVFLLILTIRYICLLRMILTILSS